MGFFDSPYLFGPPNIEKMKARRDVKGLIRELKKDPSNNMRMRAARALSEIGDPQAIEALVAELEHLVVGIPTGEWQKLAEVLAKNDAPRVVEILRPIALGSNKESRMHAIATLGRIGASGTDVLIAVLRRDLPNAAREYAAKTLVTIGALAVEPLITLLKSEEGAPADKRADDEMRKMAVKALGEIGDPRAVLPLIALLKSEGSAPADKRADDEMRKMAVKALGEIGDPRAVPLLITLLKSEGSAPDDKRADDEMRKMVVKALGEIGDPGAVLPLIALLKSNMGTPISLVEHPVAMAVLDALGEIDDPRAVLPLAAAFKEKGSWWSSGIEVLRKMGEPAVELLLEALKDEASPVSDAAPLALGRLGDPRAVPALIAALKDSRWNVREAAVQALDAFKDSRAVEPLCVLLEDGHESVRIAAAVALTGLGDSRAVPVLIAALQNCNESERDKAAVCLINLRDPAERLLSDMLQDSEPDVRMKAVHVLRDIYSRKLVVRTLKDKDAGVRSAAAQALGFIGETSEFGHLEEALKDENEDVRKEAAAAIERFHERVNWSEAQRSRDDDENALRDAMNRSY